MLCADYLFYIAHSYDVIVIKTVPLLRTPELAANCIPLSVNYTQIYAMRVSEFIYNQPWLTLSSHTAIALDPPRQKPAAQIIIIAASAEHQRSTPEMQ